MGSILTPRERIGDLAGKDLKIRYVVLRRGEHRARPHDAGEQLVNRDRCHSRRRVNFNRPYCRGRNRQITMPDGDPLAGSQWLNNKIKTRNRPLPKDQG
jgi:hypothetical protein